MTAICYFVIEKHRRWSCAKIVKVNQRKMPALKPGQAAIRLELDLPNALFDQPKATVVVDASCLRMPEIKVTATKPS